MTRLLRTIRLDQSDGVIFAPAAEPGEWAVPGTFVFAGCKVEEMGRKDQIAFRSGFLGITSFGWSTLTVVTEARGNDRAEAVAGLAHQLVTHLGAPSLDVAMPAAEEEIALAEDLCKGHDEGTLVALHRRMDDTGALREQFRTLKPRDETAFSADYLQGHDKAFQFFETDEDEGGLEIDLAELSQAEEER